MPEVYGALQTGMVDFIISTAIATVALQWHSKLTNVTNGTFGVLLGAMIMNKDKWNSIPDDVRATLRASRSRTTTRATRRASATTTTRRSRSCSRTASPATDFSAEGKKEYETMTKTVREHLVGRVYPKELLDRVTKIARGG